MLFLGMLEFNLFGIPYVSNCYVWIFVCVNVVPRAWLVDDFILNCAFLSKLRVRVHGLGFFRKKNYWNCLSIFLAQVSWSSEQFFEKYRVMFSKSRCFAVEPINPCLTQYSFFSRLEQMFAVSLIIRHRRCAFDGLNLAPFILSSETTMKKETR